jgi:type I restriction enzyme R subunit
MPQRNLAVELLQKLLKGELRIRRRKNVVQARSFAEMLEQTVRRYQNRAIEAAQVIEELIQLEMRSRTAALGFRMGGRRLLRALRAARNTQRWGFHG